MRSRLIVSLLMLQSLVAAQGPHPTMAPIIYNLPDFIIGDSDANSSATTFVFPNAINIDNFVVDDETTDSALIFTYSNPGSHYRINNALRIDGTAQDFEHPAAAYEITKNDDPASTDSNKHTITLRNSFYSPIGGAATDPGQTSDSQALTLIASDGSTHSTKTTYVRIQKGGRDALDFHIPPEPTPNPWSGWVPNVISVADGGSVTLNQEENRLCIAASAAGTNISGWASQGFYDGSNSPYNSVSLVVDAVYGARVTVSSTSAPGFTPLWYLGFENSISLYGGNYTFWDNGVSPAAGANSPAAGRATYYAYLNVPAQALPAFKAELASTQNASLKDFRLCFQVLDVGVPGSDPYGAASDTGTICMTGLRLDRYDINNMQVLSTPFYLTSFSEPVDTAPGTQNSAGNAVSVNDLSTTRSSAIHYSLGSLTIEPASPNSWEQVDAGIQVLLGDHTNSLDGSADMNDNYPIAWEADQLYRIVYTLSAPTEKAAQAPPDFIFIGGAAATCELISNTYVSNKLNAVAMPKTQPAELFAFWHGNAGTTAPARFKRMCPTLLFGTNSHFVNTPNSGGLVITGIRVERVAF